MPLSFPLNSPVTSNKRRLAPTLFAMLGLCIALIASATNIALASETNAACSSGHPLAKGGAHHALARGFNLPNWSPRYEGYRPDDALLKDLRQRGFTHIRLPIDVEQLMDGVVEAEQRQHYLDQLDETVQKLLAHDFSLSIDFHPGGSFQRLHRTNPQEGFKLLRSAWQRLAEQARTWPVEKIYFELLNEPVPDQSVWWDQAQKLVDYLAKVAPERPVIVGPAHFQRHEPLLAAEPLKGKNLIYALHYYDPFVFTHQAMTWDEGSPIADIAFLPFPAGLEHGGVQMQLRDLKQRGKLKAAEEISNSYQTPWTEERIAEVFAKVSEWSKRHNAPIIINEFGVLNFAVGEEDRIRWLKAVRKAAEAHCMGWAHWDFSDGFAMVNDATGLPDEAVMKALLSAN